MRLGIVTVLVLVSEVNADYKCLCNYNVEKKILDSAAASASSIGYLYEFDCKEKLSDVKTPTGWAAIAYTHRVGYVQIDPNTMSQICPGNPSDSDKLFPTTTPSASSASPESTKPMTTTAPTTLKPSSSTAGRSTTPIPTTQLGTTIVSTKMPETTIPTTIPPPPPTTTTTTTTTIKMTTPPTSSTTSVTETTTQPLSSSTTEKQTTTTLPTTPITTTTPRQIIAGNTSLCPVAIQHFSARDGTYLAQYDQSCYEIVSRPHTWNYAETNCKSKGGNLVHINNSGEQNFIYSMLRQHYNLKVWIGLNDLSQEGRYEWSSGDKLTYTNWVPDKGNNTRLDCVALDPRNEGLWKDQDCEDLIISLPDVFAYVCQYDIDHTGNSGGTSSSDGDTSQCPSTVRQHAMFNLGILGYHGQTCYELMPEEKVTWSHGEQICQRAGGHLLHIGSGEEQTFIQSFITRHMPHKAVWIGLNDRAYENFFHWTSGDPVTFTYWITGHIDNFVSHHDEDCTLLVPYKNGRWDDVPCGQSVLGQDYGETHPIICQYHTMSGAAIIG